MDGIFERQAVLCPQAVALQEGEVQWTYQELNQRANQIARCLRAAGAQHESLVGICLERSAVDDRGDAGGAQSRFGLCSDQSSLSGPQTLTDALGCTAFTNHARVGWRVYG